MAKETKKTALNWDEFSAGTEEKTLTVYDKIKAEKEGILKALAAGRSYKSTADYLTAGGIKITPATLKVYLSRIRQEERDAGKNPPEVEPETGEVLEGETVEELTAEVEPEIVQDQEPEPATVGQLHYLHGLIAETDYRGEIPQGKDAVSRLIDQLKEEKARATRTFTSAAVVGSSLNPGWRK